MFDTTLSFLVTTPGVWVRVEGLVVPSDAGGFLIKDVLGDRPPDGQRFPQRRVERVERRVGLRPERVSAGGTVRMNVIPAPA